MSTRWAVCIVVALLCAGATFALVATADNLTERYIAVGLALIGLTCAAVNVWLDRPGRRSS